MINKYLLIIAAVVGIAVGSGSTLLITKAVKPVIKLTCPKSPDCNCPEQKPCNGIDFDKIKSRALTIQNHQHLTVDGDSTFSVTIRTIIQEEIAKTKLSRCK